MKELKPVDIKILKISEEEIDRIQNSTLLKIPLRLNHLPPAEWTDFFMQNWKRPSKFSSLHKPSLASIRGYNIILDGTTIDEIERTHKETLQVVISDTNNNYNNWVQNQLEKLEREKLARQKREEELEKQRQAAKNVKFD